jgi:hypothetical protein
MTVSFSASLRHPSVTAEPPGSWIARGLRTVTSVAVGFDGTPAEPVGVLGWYLIRAGFAREGWALPRAGTGALAVCRPPCCARPLGGGRSTWALPGLPAGQAVIMRE